MIYEIQNKKNTVRIANSMQGVARYFKENKVRGFSARTLKKTLKLFLQLIRLGRRNRRECALRLVVIALASKDSGRYEMPSSSIRKQATKLRTLSGLLFATSN